MPTQVSRLNRLLTVWSVTACGKQEFHQIDVTVPFGLKPWEFKAGPEKCEEEKNTLSNYLK